MSEESKKDGAASGANAEESGAGAGDSNPLEAEIASLRQQLEAKDLEAKNNYEPFAAGGRSGKFQKALHPRARGRNSLRQ